MLSSEEQTGLTRQIRAGAVWAAGGNIVMRMTNVAVMAVVARIVAPDELGVFALAMTVHAFVVSMAELGVASALARSDIDPDRIGPTVTTIALMASLVLGGLMAVFAQPIAVTLGTTEATDSIRIMALGVAMIGIFAAPGAILQREFRQDQIFMSTLVSFVIGSGVLVGLGAAGWGPEAFAWSRVVTQLVAGFLLIRFSSKYYKPGINTKLVPALIKFGLPLAAANLLSQVLLNADYVFIGQMLDVADLGLYMLAFGLSVWATSLIGSVLNGLVLPAVSAIRRNGGDLVKTIATATQMVAWIAFPITGCMVVLAEPIITVLYGDQWGEAAPVLRALAIYGAVFVLGLLFANIIITGGNTGVLLVVQVASLVALLPALWVGINFAGLIGVGYAHAIVALLVSLPVYVSVMRKTTGVKISSLVRSVRIPVLASVIASVLAWVSTFMVESPLATLAVGLAIGGCSYMLMTFRLWRDYIPAKLHSKSSQRRIPGKTDLNLSSVGQTEEPVVVDSLTKEVQK